jgi:hypothetical protein
VGDARRSPCGVRFTYMCECMCMQVYGALYVCEYVRAMRMNECVYVYAYVLVYVYVSA